MQSSEIFQAYALGFSNGESSPPTVVTSGEFDIAAMIVAAAKRHGIPVVERPAMCDLLQGLEVGEEIPEALFEAAAALLVEIGAL